MKPTDVLKHEHRIIERMLKVLERACEKFERGEAVPLSIFHEGVNFVRTFADQCHHRKEENTLFPVLEQNGIPREGPIGVMLVEHDQGRGYIRELSNALQQLEKGDASAKQKVLDNTRAYIQLLNGHIWKEDNVLFMMADQVLSEADQERLMEKFEEVEKEMGEGTHQAFEQKVAILEKQIA